MGSIILSWQGACRERAAQQELLGYLHELADHSAAWLRKPQPPKPAMLQMTAGARQQTTPALPAVRVYDRTLTGRILLDPYLAPDGDRLAGEVRAVGTDMVAVAAGGLEKHEANVLTLDQAQGQWCLWVPELRVFGLDFKLYDPRGLYPQNDRLAFVFLDCPALPALGGCLAQVESAAECRSYASDVVRSADWFVRAPALHLRYYLEKWSDLFFSWVKFFFVPELVYHRYEPLSQYDVFAPRLEELARQHGRDAAKHVVFHYLAERFGQEAEDWHRQVAGWAKLTFAQMFAGKAEPTRSDVNPGWDAADVARLLAKYPPGGPRPFPPPSRKWWKFWK